MKDSVEVRAGNDGMRHSELSANVEQGGGALRANLEGDRQRARRSDRSEGKSRIAGALTAANMSGGES